MARRIKYYYDPLSMAFKKIERTWKHWVRDVSLFALTTSLVGILLFFLLSAVFDSPREKQLQRELDETKTTHISVPEDFLIGRVLSKNIIDSDTGELIARANDLV